MKEEMEWHKKAKALSERNSVQMKSGAPPTLRLTVELVPKPLWGRSLAKLAPRSEWGALRQQVFEKYAGKCAICGATARIAHEVWEYNDAAHVQRLRDIIPICDVCNLVKHLGRTGVLAAQGEVVQSQAIYHFLEVNGCDLKTFYAHERQVFDTWHERSRHKWTIDYGPYAHLVRPDGDGTLP